MSGLTFEETVERYAWLSGLPIDVAREQMRQQLARTIAGLQPSFDALSRLIVEGIASGIRPGHFRIRPPRRAARRAHSRKVKRG